MNRPGRPPRRSDGPGFLERAFEPGDTIPFPDTLEVESAEAWEAWEGLHRREQSQFARTLPMAELPAADEDPGFAPTQPLPLGGQTPRGGA